MCLGTGGQRGRENSLQEEGTPAGPSSRGGTLLLGGSREQEEFFRLICTIFPLFSSVRNTLIHIFLAGNSDSKTLLPPSVTSSSHPQTSSPPPQPPPPDMFFRERIKGWVRCCRSLQPVRHITEYDRKSRAAPVAEATAHCCQHKLLAAECLSESCDAFGATNHAGCSLQGRAGVTLSPRELLLSIQTN